MSESRIAFTVVLDGEYGEEASDAIGAALKMVKGVATVHPVVSNFETDIATEQARYALLRELGDVARKWRR